MTTTPPGWKATTLGELGRYLNGRAFKKSEWGPDGRPIIRIQNLTGSNSAYNYFRGGVQERYVVRAGDLLVSWAATLGAYIWAGEEAVLNQHIFKVESNIDTRFHKYLLDHKLNELMRHTHGSGMVHITRGRFDSIPVAVPSLDEQRRVVDLLEDNLSRLDAAVGSLQRSLRRADAMVVSSLAAQVTDGGENWISSTIGAQAEVIQYGSSAKCDERALKTDVPVLRMGNVKDGALVWGSLKYLAEDHADFPKLLLQPGDLLFNRTNSAEHVGKSAVFDSDCVASFASYLIRVRFGPEILPAWANMVINSPMGREYVASVVSQQVGQANVNSTKLKAFPLPLPTRDEQERRIKEHSEFLEGRARLTSAVDFALSRAVGLRRSLLAAAFCGRLTSNQSIEEIA